MNNKQLLLDGAVKCLLKLGYARTTARDIAGEAGVSLAAIGYHYGTTEALLNRALIRATEMFSEALNEALSSQASIVEFDKRFEVIWENIYKQFDQNQQLWRVNVEVVAQAEHSESLRKTLIEAQPEARQGLAILFHGSEIMQNAQRAEAIGAIYQALLFGLLSQRLINPAASLSAEALTGGLRHIVASLGADPHIP